MSDTLDVIEKLQYVKELFDEHQQAARDDIQAAITEIERLRARTETTHHHKGTKINWIKYDDEPPYWETDLGLYIDMRLDGMFDVNVFDHNGVTFFKSTEVSLSDAKKAAEAAYNRLTKENRQ